MMNVYMYAPVRIVIHIPMQRQESRLHCVKKVDSPYLFQFDQTPQLLLEHLNDFLSMMAVVFIIFFGIHFGCGLQQFDVYFRLVFVVVE